MGIKLLMMKDREKNEYRHYLQEYFSWLFMGEPINISDDGICPEHDAYLVDIIYEDDQPINYIEYLTNTTSLEFGKAGRR